jgi:DNA helicase IV
MNKSSTLQICRLSNDWKLDITLLGACLRSKTQELKFSIKEIQSIEYTQNSLEELCIQIVSKANKNPETYILSNFSKSDADRLLKLYENYSSTLAKLRDLYIKIRTWNKLLYSEISNEFNNKGYITDSWTNDNLKKIFAKKPKDTYKLLRNIDVIELLQHTMSKEEYRSIKNYSRTAKSMQELFNNFNIKNTIIKQDYFFNNIEKTPLTLEQKIAVVTLNDKVLLNASAGSGKTSTMVARMAYICAFNYHQNGGVLALAYNAAAVNELQIRAKQRFNNLGINFSPVMVKTFHALGLEIISMITGKRPKLASGLDNEENENSSFKQCVLNLFKKNASFRHRLSLFVNLFTDDSTVDTQTITKTSNLALAAHRVLELANIPNTLQRSSFSNSYCLLLLSKQEIIIHHKCNDPGTVEHGYKLLGAITYEELENKLGFFKLLRLTNKKNTKSIGTEYSFHRTLESINNNCQQLLKTRDFYNTINLLKAFLTLSKNSLKEGSYLDSLLSNSKTKKQFSFRDKLFISLYKSIYKEWSIYLNNCIDFEDMLNEAARLIDKHQWKMPVTHILIDECQDISGARARLIQNIIKYNGARIFAVGDDWQSINRFSGSELSVMTDFSSYFGQNDLLKLEKTFRCSQNICNITSKFILKNPRQLKKKVHSVANYNEQPVSIYEQKNLLELEFAIMERVKQIVEENHNQPVTILLLGRYNNDFELVKKTLADPKLAPYCRFLTVHRSKGLEADYVILVRVTSEYLGFPSKITDDPLLKLVEPSPDNYPFAEERRLFYVALTRARRHISIFSIINKRSIFIDELYLQLKPQIKIQHIKISENLIPKNILCRNPNCQGYYILKRSVSGNFWGCCNYPECKSTLKSLDFDENQHQSCSRKTPKTKKKTKLGFRFLV